MEKERDKYLENKSYQRAHNSSAYQIETSNMTTQQNLEP